MKVTVASVIYAEALSFWNDFIQSLQNQDMRDFDVLLINDNIPFDILKRELNNCDKDFLKRISIVDKNKDKLLPYELRIEMLKEALDRNTDLLILADFDDKTMPNRVSETCQQYDERYTFFYNEFLDFEGNKLMPDMPEITDTVDFILECNYLGWSNCALNLHHLSKEFIESMAGDETLIFDWYLFSRILLNHGKGKRINGTATFYRIHENNVDGIKNLTVDSLEKERKIKIEHYQLLEKYDSRYYELMEKYKSIDIDSHLPDSKKYGELQFWWNLFR